MTQPFSNIIMANSNQYQARALAYSVQTLNREIRELQTEYNNAPTFSFTKRVKVQIAEEIVRLEARKSEYVRQLNTLNRELRTNPTPKRSSSRQESPQQMPDSRGWDKVGMQHQIDQLYNEIGSVGEELSHLGYTPERKQLICKHKELIRKRRQLIWQINSQ